MGITVYKEKIHINKTIYYLNIRKKSTNTYAGYLKNTTDLKPKDICQVLSDLTIVMMYARCANVPIENANTLPELSVFKDSMTYFNVDMATKFSKILDKYPVNSNDLSDMYEVLICNAQGSYYTAHDVAKYMCWDVLTKYILREYNAKFQTDHTDLATLPKDSGQVVYDLLKNVRICEPCVGTGNYIFALFEVIFKIYDTLGLKYVKYIIMLKMLANNIYTMEYNPKTIIIYKLRLILILREYNIYDFDWNMFCGDASSYVDWSAFLKYKVCYLKNDMNLDSNVNLDTVDYNDLTFVPFFDIIVTNPPYVRKHLDIKLEIYKHRYVYDYNANLCWYIFETLVNITKDEGILGLLVFHKLHEFSSTMMVRDFVIKNLNFTKCVEWSTMKGFKNTDVSTAIYTFVKSKTQGDLEYYRINDITNVNDNTKVTLPPECLTKERFILNYETSEVKMSKFIRSTCTKLINFQYKNKVCNLLGSDVFVLDNNKKQAILSRCKTQDELERTQAIILPLLKYVKKAYYVPLVQEYYILNIYEYFPNHECPKSVHENEEDFAKLYPSLYEYMLNYKDYLSKIKKSSNYTGNWYTLDRKNL